jgi:hypothetical protein
MEFVDVPVWTVTSSAVIIRRSIEPPPSSTCSGISRGAISTTCGDRPMSRSAFAASSPSRPPPMTTAERRPRPGLSTAAARIASRSSMVR